MASSADSAGVLDYGISTADLSRCVAVLQRASGIVPALFEPNGALEPNFIFCGGGFFRLWTLNSRCVCDIGKSRLRRIFQGFIKLVSLSREGLNQMAVVETAASQSPGVVNLAGSHRSVDNAIIIVVLWAKVDTDERVEGNCSVQSAGRIVCSASKGFQASFGSRDLPSLSPPEPFVASSANSRKICIRKCGVCEKNLRVSLLTGISRARVARVSRRFYRQFRGSCATVLSQTRWQWRKTFFLVRAH